MSYSAPSPLGIRGRTGGKEGGIGSWIVRLPLVRLQHKPSSFILGKRKCYKGDGTGTQREDRRKRTKEGGREGGRERERSLRAERRIPRGRPPKKRPLDRSALAHQLRSLPWREEPAED